MWFNVLLQTNPSWLTSDSKLFITAEWNNGMLKHASDFGAGWLDDEDHEFISALEPGSDGDCVVILYIREYQPSWKMLPCAKHLSRYWICKIGTRVHNVIRHMDYPSLWCRGRCLVVDYTCFKYIRVIRFSNNSIGCLIDHPYLSYLNNNFANRSINIIFTVFCSDMVVDMKRRQIELASGNETSINRSDAVKIYRLRKTDTDVSMCGPTMHQCDDGSCRTQSIICMLDFQCARNLCACMLGTHIIINIEYCRYQCPPRICNCGHLMFQCSSGGCIPYSYVCDNEYNCADSSDEFCIADGVAENRLENTPIDFRSVITQSSHWCFGFKCSSGLCIDVHFVNDLIPDCTDAGDEYHSLSMKYMGVYFDCEDMQEMPCAPGHSKCFGINHLCVYDYDKFGHISYCRDGAHLMNCRYMKCTNTFKCPRSYCVPLRRVCDGIYDCYNGEDENNCHNNICRGYLKCREVEFCIHPTEICDGYRHCPHGDDEKFCDVHVCPSGCICLGRGVVCEHERITYIPELHSQDVIYMSVISGYLPSPIFTNLSSLSRLVFIDLSNASVINICAAFENDYMFYDSLHVLYLQRNNINYLQHSCFTKLLSLLVLNLQGNPLVDIADDAFTGITLEVLVIKDTYLSSMTWYWIDGFYSIKSLDIRGVKLDYLSYSAVDSINELEIVYAEDPMLCCILSNIKACPSHTKSRLQCSIPLSRAILSPILIFITAASLVVITISTVLISQLYAVSRPVQCMLHNSILMNRALCVLYILVTEVLDLNHRKHNVFGSSSLLSKFFCQGLHVIFSSGVVMSNISTSLLEYITHNVVSRMLFNENYVHGQLKKLLGLMHILMIKVFSLITLVLDKKLVPRKLTDNLCGNPLGVFVNGYELSVIGPAILSIALLLSLIYSIYTYSTIFKYAYISVKSVQTMTSTKMNVHQSRLFKLLKTLVHFTAFRSLECLLIMCIVLTKLYGTHVSVEMESLSIMSSVILGLIGNTMPTVWYLIFRHSHT